VGCDRRALGQTTAVSIVVVASIGGQPMQSTCSLYDHACVWSSGVLALQRRHNTCKQPERVEDGGFCLLVVGLMWCTQPTGPTVSCCCVLCCCLHSASFPLFPRARARTHTRTHTCLTVFFCWGICFLLTRVHPNAQEKSPTRSSRRLGAGAQSRHHRLRPKRSRACT